MANNKQSNQSWAIEELPGLDAQMAASLKKDEICTTLDLLRKASLPQSQQELANKLKVKTQLVTKWVAMADLSRIPGVGCQYCGLLLHAGIATIPQMANARSVKLHHHMLRLQVKMMQRRDLCPTVNMIQQWIHQARYLMS